MAESTPKGIKHCGKRRNCLLQAISPFPTVFSKDLYCRQVKTRACLEKSRHDCGSIKKNQGMIVEASLSRAVLLNPPTRHKNVVQLLALTHYQTKNF